MVNSQSKLRKCRAVYFIGLQTQEVNTGKSVINVTLKSDSAELQEVVVGYGVKRKV
jgi:riboflavin synthase